MNDAFFILHTDLPREGPGAAEDVRWAVREAGLKRGARICDAGSGPGGDIEALLDAVPDAHVTAVDTHADFVEDVARKHAGARVDARQGDMMDIVGPYDFIWSAGAIYFPGIEAALTGWRKALVADGRVAFSYPAFFTDTPSEGARSFWQGFDAVMTAAEIKDAVERSGYRIIASRPVGDDGWEAYFGPIRERVASLRRGAGVELAAVLDEAEAEENAWRTHKDETGYILTVTAPK